MLKALIGRGHPEFSTMRQQDAQEFFLHLLSCTDKAHRSTPPTPGSKCPSDYFKFLVCVCVCIGGEGVVPGCLWD